MTRPSMEPFNASHSTAAMATAVLETTFGRARHQADAANSAHIKTNERNTSGSDITSDCPFLRPDHVPVPRHEAQPDQCKVRG